MTEITRVPLQPITKGSLTKLWIGILLVLLLAAGTAWAAMPQGVSVTQLQAGTGSTPATGDVVFVDYVGKLADGTEFDRSQPAPFPPGLLPAGTPMLLEEGQLIPGFLQGLQQMQKGGRYRLEIPAALAYGETPPPGAPIPPNSDLVFEVTLNDFMSRAEVEQRIQAVQQQMMQQQMMQGADPSAPPAAQ